MKKDNYQKAADEIIKAVKELPIGERVTPFSKIDLRKAKKLIIEMLKTNFTAKKVYK